MRICIMFLLSGIWPTAFHIFQISKKQHELVKSMRQSGSSIQSKALNRLLGSLDSSNVKPYEMFVEEEQKRLHEHWYVSLLSALVFILKSFKSLMIVLI